MPPLRNKRLGRCLDAARDRGRGASVDSRKTGPRAGRGPRAAGLVAAGVRSARRSGDRDDDAGVHGELDDSLRGLKTRDYTEMIGGAIIVVALAGIDALLALVFDPFVPRTTFADSRQLTQEKHYEMI